MLNDLVLSKKREKSQEYTLHLFEHCNMTCNFCWQKHDDFTGTNTVRQKIPVLLEMLSQNIDYDVTLNIMGGEIFSDLVFNESLMEDYVALVTAANNFCKLHDKKLTVFWVTNLVFSKVDLVKKLLSKCNEIGFEYSISTSYDSAGRFNINNFEVWKHNLQVFKPWIQTISVLLTKPNMNRIIKGDKRFQKLYDEGWYIYFDYYMPDSDWDTIGPTDKDLLEFFTYCIDNYPNVHPLNEWINSHVNLLSCRSSKLLMPDNTICMCGNLVDEKVIQWYDSAIHKSSNKDVETNFVERNECLTCEYFNRCQLGCFLQHDFSLRRDLEECVFKLVFDRIENK